MIEYPCEIEKKWNKLDNERTELLERCEQYARWTLPTLFPDDTARHSDTPQEVEKGNVAIGARLINHLAHRIVDTMFPTDKPFFALQLRPSAEASIKEEGGAENVAKVRAGLARVENAGMRNMDLTSYRAKAVEAMQLKLITGNAVIYRLPNNKRVVYSLRDFVCERSIDGALTSIMLRDNKKFVNLSTEEQEALKAGSSKKKYEEDTNVTLYTYFELQLDSRWLRRQALDHVDLDNEKYYTDTEFPCLVLAWNLSRGENYATGLVEDYAVSFHNIDVMTEALIDLIGIAADIKFLVDPSSMTSAEDWNEARRGEYVAGRKDDITTPDFEFAIQIQVLVESISKLEKELAQAFLLNSAGVRDAERVTAEEIRFFAREIESAFGGMYSRLAIDWQKREAEYQLAMLDFSMFIPGYGEQAFDTQIVTGLESLSREGKLDALRLAFADLQMLDAVPEDVRMAVNPLKLMDFVFRHRGVKPEDILRTEDEYQQAQDRELQNQQALAETQGAVAAATK